LQRYMLHADWHLSPTLRVFGQLKSGLAPGKAGGPEPPDEDRLDLHQAFADLRLPTAPNQALTLRVGRQELSYGSSRLVSVREGPNVRQSFDAVKAFYQTPAHQLDLFVSRPVQTKRYTFDDASIRAGRFGASTACTNSRSWPAPPGRLLSGAARPGRRVSGKRPLGTPAFGGGAPVERRRPLRL
jgi:transposase